MRILFDSQQRQFKDPFGTLVPNQACTLHIHVPSDVQAIQVYCVLNAENGEEVCRVPMALEQTRDAYDIFFGTVQLPECGLYYYYFYVVKQNAGFRLFKQGHDTNMEAGDCWQLSCVPEDFATPDWAKGAVIYQIFPDRFCKEGDCDLYGKLEPYVVHENWNEEVVWQAVAEDTILNNDFFGGNFRGITKKMDYIASLGTTILYLNPIGKSFSNHRYDTGDYKVPDPMLGTVEDFSAMCEAAHAHGIRVILDGVYSHTGSNSVYFDKENVFGGQGAYVNPESPYRSWYTFKRYPDRYESWWGFKTLPTVRKMDPKFMEFIITGEDSVIAYWLRLGADGLRLDVADELPDAFILRLKQRLREIKPDALLIGEVWEDASCKVAYGVRRRYFVDGMLDSCMNYPFRTAILQFMRGQDDGKNLENTVMTIAENYPAQVLHCNMNLLGSHDTPRILTALLDDFEGSREEQAIRCLSVAQKAMAKELLLMASFLQFMLPGAPSIYYADEVGMEGHKDPFNRRTYPWGQEDSSLLAHFRALGMLRKEQRALQTGEITFFQSEDGRIGFCRGQEKDCLKIYVNRKNADWEIPSGKVLMGRNIRAMDANRLVLAPMSFCLVKE